MCSSDLAWVGPSSLGPPTRARPVIALPASHHAVDTSYGVRNAASGDAAGRRPRRRTVTEDVTPDWDGGPPDNRPVSERR